MTPVELYGVAVCGVAALVIADPSRAARLRSLVTGAAVVGATTYATALLPNAALVESAAMLVLIFVSFVSRPAGLLAGEMALLATMGWYLGVNVGARASDVGPFVVAVGVGLSWLVAWEIVIVPFRPQRDLERAVAALVRRCGEGAAAVAARWSGAAGAAPHHRALGRVERQIDRTRRVIEQQFPGVLAPQGWSRDRIAALQLALFGAQGGLGQLLRAAQAPAIDHAPEGVRSAASTELDLLVQWSAAVADSASAAPDSLGDPGAGSLPAAIETARRGAVGPDQPMTDWLAPAVQTARGSRRAVKGITDALAACVAARGVPVAAPARRQAVATVVPSAVTIAGRFEVRPTTALGMQAVVATGAAMLLAALLRMPHPNWVYWSAFVVIAGSAGESIRKIGFRVAGTVAGTAAGVLVVFLAPSNAPVAIAAVCVALFFAVFFSPVSYVGFVFWLNVVVVVVFAAFDSSTIDVLVERPRAAALGALVSAVVALFVLPVRVGHRYRVLLAAFAAASAEAVDAWVDLALGIGDRSDAAVAVLGMRTAHAAAVGLLPSVVFENNPVALARRTTADAAPQSAALVAGIDELVGAADALAGDGLVDGAPVPVAGGAQACLISALRDRVRGDLSRTSLALHGEQVGANTSLHDLLDEVPPVSLDGQSPVEELMWSLVRLHSIEVEFSAAAGVPNEPSPRQSRRQKGSA